MKISGEINEIVKIIEEKSHIQNTDSMGNKSFFLQWGDDIALVT